MTQRELVELVLKLGGVFLLVSAVTDAPGLLLFVAALSRDAGLRGVVGTTHAVNGTADLLVLAAVGVTLIAYGERWAQRLVPEERSVALGQATARQLLWIGVALVGVAFGLNAGAGLASTLVQGFWELGGERRHEADLTDTLLLVIELAVLFAGAVWLARWAERRLEGEEPAPPALEPPPAVDPGERP